MDCSLQHIARIIHAEPVIVHDAVIVQLLTDSRKIVFPEQSLFFAISGPRRNGHQFIHEVYERGVRNFVVGKDFDQSPFSDANFLKVDHVLKALQALAAWRRRQFDIPVIGITGSNGKTIVKEWLYQLLHDAHSIVRSPRSYNSQLGVPLSVWQMDATDTLGIFEAGISTVGEMETLAEIIQPTIGVFTNLADAHSEGFADMREKALEKAKLFSKAHALIYCVEALKPALDPAGDDKILFPEAADLFTWSRQFPATLQVKEESRAAAATVVQGVCQDQAISITIPFTDRISVDNALTCVCVLLQMGYALPWIQERLTRLQSVDMRMQLIKGINNTYILNDSYSNDTASLELALDYLQQQAGNQKTTLILSDILQSGHTQEQLYRQVAEQLRARSVQRLIGIGPAISAHAGLFGALPVASSFYPSTDAFLQQFSGLLFRDEYVLLKGARIFEFERISALLEQQVHQTVMQINLSAMIHNLKAYQQQLEPSTKLMAMVKAFSYGSGSAEVARALQFHKLDYLAVAYADEGVELRKAGISLPIMVMNADAAGFEALVSYDLEPEIYSFTIFEAFHRYLRHQGISGFPVHINFNARLNRL
ncbi:MAG: alanine racemase, partial [Chitinophagaceae bacterium]|nr:alanine racemase [Chitinophagaceae bacterium]